MENFNLIIGKFIITFVIIAAVVASLGGVLYLWQNGHETINYHLFQGEPKMYTSFSGILDAAFSFSAKGIIQLGILLLVLGQVGRVFLTLCLFVKEKDYFFSFSSLFIFVIMVVSLLSSTLR